MKFDRFDKILISLLAIAAVALLAYTAQSFPAKTTAIESRSMERELASQARVGLLEKLYSPVTVALQNGQYQEALLKLEEVNIRYPGEAHGFILKGEILYRMGVLDGAAAGFIRGIKLSGDYIDKNSPFSKRDIIAILVEKSLPPAQTAYKNSHSNPALKENLSNLNYLKSRLAGGCE